ncbi:hypothetical protein AB0M39_38090 [Streptomyces sp. NPDC051907]|uniref:hypothetical protein n=1 Tax=Streptomyces sp. NPDC051907 TaxID=3155284 RepID=UPI003438B7E5
MAPRSPWRDGRINVCFGEELPPLIRHHRNPRSHGLTKTWRPVRNSGRMNKPVGGLWTAPAVLPAGKWRPVPKRSTWTDWCASEAPHWINNRYQTLLRARPDAVFAVIDTAADAVALYEAFPNDGHPVAVALRGGPSRLFGRMIDWERVLDRQIAGVYLTDRGQHETHLPEEDFVPSLYDWDAASVWFSMRDAYRTVGKPRRSPWIDPDPYGTAWDDAEDGPERPDLGQAAAALRGANESLARAIVAAKSEDAPALRLAVEELRALPEAGEPGQVAEAIEMFEGFLQLWEDESPGS